MLDRVCSCFGYLWLFCCTLLVRMGWLLQLVHGLARYVRLDTDGLVQRYGALAWYGSHGSFDVIWSYAVHALHARRQLGPGTGHSIDFALPPSPPAVRTPTMGAEQASWVDVTEGTASALLGGGETGTATAEMVAGAGGGGTVVAATGGDGGGDGAAAGTAAGTGGGGDGGGSTVTGGSGKEVVRTKEEEEEGKAAGMGGSGGGGDVKKEAEGGKTSVRFGKGATAMEVDAGGVGTGEGRTAAGTAAPWPAPPPMGEARGRPNAPQVRVGAGKAGTQLLREQSLGRQAGTQTVEVTLDFDGWASYGKASSWFRNRYDVLGSDSTEGDNGRVSGVFWINMSNEELAEYAASKLRRSWADSLPIPGSGGGGGTAEVAGPWPGSSTDYGSGGGTAVAAVGGGGGGGTAAAPAATAKDKGEEGGGRRERKERGSRKEGRRRRKDTKRRRRDDSSSSGSPVRGRSTSRRTSSDSSRDSTSLHPSPGDAEITQQNVGWCGGKGSC